ncbi:MAG: polysaccharide biosynthesis C-terminal domain-containing protein, partial [Acutalibacteraceae bacterium]|nr:polysaccharide biosynthesis C-terminal domain-containing protein [Acutalibacteraceae bacterium]
RNVLIGVATKVTLNAILVGIPEINIVGAAYSTLACYTVIVTLNLTSLMRHSGVMPNLWGTLGKPAISGILCMITAGATSTLFGNLGLSLVVSTAISVTLGGIVYIFVLFALKTLTKEDIKLLPKGEKIAKVLEKFKLLG